jgi:hypothetical protein
MTARRSDLGGMSQVINLRTANVFGVTYPVGGEHAS